MQAEEAAYQKASLNPIDLLQESLDLIKDQYWLFVLICFLGLIISSYVPLNILTGPMFCGMYYCMFKKMRQEQVEIGELFRGFDYFLDSFIVAILVLALSLVVGVPLMFVGIAVLVGGSAVAEGSESAMGALVALGWLPMLLLYFLVMFFIYILFSFSFQLIVDRGMSAIPAMTASAKAVMSNLGGILLLFLVIGVIGFIATMLCYLPVFLFAPIAIGALALAYDRVFPPEESAEA